MKTITDVVYDEEGVMERMVPKTTRPDVVYDEDTDHFYLNGVGKVDKKDITQKNNIIFWNCNGWRGDRTIDKATLLGGIAKDEDAEMMCITDVRLDNWEGLKGRASLCRTLEKATGKTWGGEYISRREDKRVGGAYILHTVDWTNVKITQKIKYGIITDQWRLEWEEIQGGISIQTVLWNYGRVAEGDNGY